MLTSLSKKRPKIFLSYRRDDSEASTDLLLEQLVSHFGRKQIFVDVDDVSLGEDFIHAIEKAVSSCDVLLAVIGKQWLTITNAHGRRLDDVEDFVRLEIVTAIRRNILTIPVLVQGATMPRPEDLPDDLKPLTRRQAFAISRPNRKGDEARLIRKIEKSLAERAVLLRSQTAPSPPVPRPAAPKSADSMRFRLISTALMLTTLFVLALGVWQLYKVLRNEEPGLDAGEIPVASPGETVASPSDATPTPIPSPLTTVSPSPLAQTEKTPQPKTTPDVASVKEEVQPTPLSNSNLNPNTGRFANGHVFLDLPARKPGAQPTPRRSGNLNRSALQPLPVRQSGENSALINSTPAEPTPMPTPLRKKGKKRVDDEDP